MEEMDLLVLVLVSLSSCSCWCIPRGYLESVFQCVHIYVLPLALPRAESPSVAIAIAQGRVCPGCLGPPVPALRLLTCLPVFVPARPQTCALTCGSSRPIGNTPEAALELVH